jgi:hypothetical protein
MQFIGISNSVGSKRAFWELCSSGLLRMNSGNSLTTFRNNLSVPISRIKNPRRKPPEDGANSLSRNVGNDLPLLMPDNPEENGSHIFSGGSLKSRKRHLCSPKVHNISEDHPTSYLVGTGVLTGGKEGGTWSLTLNPLTSTIVAPPSNASKWQMGFNSAFKWLVELHLVSRLITSPAKQPLLQ